MKRKKKIHIVLYIRVLRTPYGKMSTRGKCEENSFPPTKKGVRYHPNPERFQVSKERLSKPRKRCQGKISKYPTYQNLSRSHRYITQT